MGTYLWCPNYNALYGSLCIYRQLCQYNEAAYVHILHGGHHENSETTGYNDDFTMTNTACFFHKLMRGEKITNNIFYDWEYSCDVPVHQAVELTYYRDKDEDGFGNINDFLVDTVKPGVMLLTALIATTKTILSILVQKKSLTELTTIAMAVLMKTSNTPSTGMLTKTAMAISTILYRPMMRRKAM